MTCVPQTKIKPTFNVFIICKIVFFPSIPFTPKLVPASIFLLTYTTTSRVLFTFCFHCIYMTELLVHKLVTPKLIVHPKRVGGNHLPPSCLLMDHPSIFLQYFSSILTAEPRCPSIRSAEYGLA